MSNEESEEMGSTLRIPRVFINHMDSYHGKKLTDCFLGVCENGHAMRDDEEVELKVMGTIQNAENLLNHPDTRILDPHNKETFLNELLSCTLVIYDITLDDGQIHEAEWALEALSDALESLDYPPDDVEPLHFLLISPIMTWAHTRQLDPQNSNAPLNELDYRKRVPHVNFTRHKDCESRVISIKDHSMLQKKSMKKLKPLVLCVGVTYGNEEGPLHFLFKLAWHNSPFLPIFAAGTNRIPLLHIADLSRIVHSLFYKWPEDRWYLVAVEINAISQASIVENISRHMSTGDVKNVETLEESIFKENISRRDLDVIMVDVNIEPAFTVDYNMQSERSFDMQVERVLNEYRVSRNLQPMKIIILGPPASGKTAVAMRIAQYYKIPYISMEELITETISNLTIAIEEEGSLVVKTSEYSKDNGEDEKQRVVAADHDFSSKPLDELQRQLDEICNNLSLNNGHPTDDIMNKLLKTKLQLPECINQGYILDGYPKTWNQANELFNNKVIYNENSTLIPQNMTMFPEFVIQLEAADEFLYNRVRNLPESAIQGRHYNVESMMKRLGDYRKTNTGNDTTREFFIENGIHPLIFDVERVGMHSTFQRCLETIGEPRNYGPTAVERVAEATIRDSVDVRGTSVIGAEGVEEMAFQRKMTRNEDMREWRNNMENLQKAEENELRALSELLRLYLVKYIFPTLSQGLLSMVQSRPENPLNSLATYLFCNNPEGKMIGIPDQLLDEMDEHTSADVTENFFEDGSNDIDF